VLRDQHDHIRRYANGDRQNAQRDACEAIAPKAPASTGNGRVLGRGGSPVPSSSFYERRGSRDCSSGQLQPALSSYLIDGRRHRGGVPLTSEARHIYQGSWRSFSLSKSPHHHFQDCFSPRRGSPFPLNGVAYYEGTPSEVAAGSLKGLHSPVVGRLPAAIRWEVSLVRVSHACRQRPNVDTNVKDPESRLSETSGRGAGATPGSAAPRLLRIQSRPGRTTSPIAGRRLAEPCGLDRLEQNTASWTR